MVDEETRTADGSAQSPKDSVSNVPTPPTEKAPAMSKKRSSPEDGNDVVREPIAKRRRVEEHVEGRGLPSPPPEHVITAILDDRPAFDDEPLQLLRRAMALILGHIGFDGATNSALEELCGEFDSCKLILRDKKVANSFSCS
jgi:hypothetical protein